MLLNPFKKRLSISQTDILNGHSILVHGFLNFHVVCVSVYMCVCVCVCLGVR